MKKKFIKLNILAFLTMFMFGTPALSQINIEEENIDLSAINLEINSPLIYNDSDLKKNMLKYLIKNSKSKRFSSTITKEENGGIPEGVKFQADEIEFYGNTVIPSKKLAKFTKKLKGKEIDLSDLKKLCDEITKYYHEQGYVTSKAYIPAQKVDNHKVEIAIKEGSYGDIDVGGNKWADKEYLSDILYSNGVKPDEVLNVYALDNSLKEINKHSYMHGKISVNKSKYTNQADIDLKIKDRLPLDIIAGWNNEGQDYFGKQLASVGVSYNNISGKGESASAGTLFSTGVLGAFASLSKPLDEKTKVITSYSYTNSSFGEDLSDYDILGNTHTLKAGITRKLHRGKKWTLDGDIGVEAKNSVTEMGLLDLELNKYKVRSLVSGITAQKKDKYGMWVARGETRTGLPCCGATEYSDNLNLADSKYISGNVKLRRYQKLPFGLLGVLKTDGQYSPNKLLAPEKMYLGGSNSIRGYKSSAVLGDYGFVSSVEIRKELPFIDDLLPDKLKHLKNRFHIGGFYDCGYVGDSNLDYEPTGTNFLQSAGVSLHIPLTKMITSSLNFGVPIGNSEYKDKNFRFSFNLATDIHNLWAKDLSQD